VSIKFHYRWWWLVIVRAAVVRLLWMQAEYREKRRRYLTQFDGVPPELYSADLVDYTYLAPPPAISSICVAPSYLAPPAVSSSSSADQDGPPSSPGLVINVSRQNSVSSGDAFVDLPASATSGSLAGGDGMYPGQGRGEVDGWSLPGASGGDDRDDDDAGGLGLGQAGLGSGQRSVSASDPSFFQTHGYDWIKDDPEDDDDEDTALSAEVPPTPEVEELDDLTAANETITGEPSSTMTNGDPESSGLTLASTASTDVTPTNDVELAVRWTASSSTLSPSHHQRLSAAERRLVNKQLLLNSSVLEAS